MPQRSWRSWGWMVAILVVAAMALVGCQGGGSAGWSPVAVGEVVGEDGSALTVLFVGTSEGEILALDVEAIKTSSAAIENLTRDQIEGCRRSDGTPCLLWSFAPQTDPEPAGLFGPAALGDEFLYVGINDKRGGASRLYALKKDRPSIGQLDLSAGEWVRTIGGLILSGAALSPDQDMVLIGTDDGYFYAVDTADGTLRWQFPRAGEDSIGKIWSTPAVDDQRVYFGSLDHKVYALSLKDGTIVAGWPFDTGGSVVGKPLLVGSRVIVGSFDRKLYSINAATGSGQSILSADNWFWAGPVSDGSSIYAPSMDGEVHILDRNGNPTSSFKIDGTIVSRPWVLEDEGERFVVVANEDGELYLLRDGAQVCPTKFGTGDAKVEDLLVSSKVKAPLDGAGNVLFLGTTGDTVWSVAIENDCLRTLWRVDIKR